MGKEINNRELASADFRASIGMVFQRFSLYPHMPVMKNLTLVPRKVRGLATREAETFFSAPSTERAKNFIDQILYH
jgi:ABC-type polar amino acid transport system ATPase subunit